MRIPQRVLSGMGQACVVGNIDPTTGDTIANCPIDNPNNPVGPTAAQGVTINPVTGQPVAAPCAAGTLMNAAGQCVATPSACPVGQTCTYIAGVPDAYLYYGVFAIVGLMVVDSFLGGRRR